MKREKLFPYCYGKFPEVRKLRKSTLNFSFYFTLPVSPQVQHWWGEIHTNRPQCTYYFGPFETVQEARGLQDGYLEDLMQEEARIITVEIKQCQPKELTICLTDEV